MWNLNVDGGMHHRFLQYASFLYTFALGNTLARRKAGVCILGKTIILHRRYNSIQVFDFLPISYYRDLCICLLTVVPLLFQYHSRRLNDGFLCRIAGVKESKIRIDLQQAIPILNCVSSFITEEFVHFLKSQVFSLGNDEIDKCRFNTTHSTEKDEGLLQH